MTNPAEEIYVIFNKKTGGRKKYPIVHAYLSEKMGIGQFARAEKEDYAIAKYRPVEAKENRE